LTMEDAQRLQQLGHRFRHQQRWSGDDRAEPETGPQNAGADRAHRHPLHDRGAGGRDQREPEHAQTAIDQHHGSRERLGAGRLGRVGDTDHVAADVAGQEIVEERRDEERLREKAERQAHVLRAPQDAPSERARQQHRQVEQQREGEPSERRLPRHAPQARHVDPREEQREQSDADDGLDQRDGERTAHSNPSNLSRMLQLPVRQMRILMIAPEPFFEPRGSPFSEYHRIRALVELGHTVDLVTYPFGHDVAVPGLRVFRCARPPLMKGIGIGPSWKKLPLDLALMITAGRRAWVGKYDAVHSHEEGSWFGVVLASLLGLPHLYDMHSSLPQQLTNFAYSPSRMVKSIFGALERFVVRRSRVVIVICPQLEEVVRGIDTAVPSVLIENAPGSGDAPVEGSGAPARRVLGLAAETPMILYTGTFEAYQGLDLLFASMKHVIAVRPEARLVLAGGRPEQIEAAQRQATAAGIGAATIFAGQRPAEEIPAFLDAADV